MLRSSTNREKGIGNCGDSIRDQTGRDGRRKTHGRSDPIANYSSLEMARYSGAPGHSDYRIDQIEYLHFCDEDLLPS